LRKQYNFSISIVQDGSQLVSILLVVLFFFTCVYGLAYVFALYYSITLEILRATFHECWGPTVVFYVIFFIDVLTRFY
jgi:hypothetical protein